MARVVVIGDPVMTDAVSLTLRCRSPAGQRHARERDHARRRGSGANIAAWMAADGGDVAFVGRRGADIAGRNRDMELMGYGTSCDAPGW